jgi:hypothetical protein
MVQAGLIRMADVALEICGECVPRQYAPGLKDWMNQVQEMAGRLRAAA